MIFFHFVMSLRTFGFNDGDQDNGSDVCIASLKDRNRALNGDVVVVVIYPRSEWKVSSLTHSTSW